MPIHVRITYSIAVALFALGAVLYFVKVDSSNCVVSWATIDSLNFVPDNSRYDLDLGGLAGAVAKTCAEPAKMTTSRIWGMSLAAFAVALIASTWWLNESASAQRDFFKESD